MRSEQVARSRLSCPLGYRVKRRLKCLISYNIIENIFDNFLFSKKSIHKHYQLYIRQQYISVDKYRRASVHRWRFKFVSFVGSQPEDTSHKRFAHFAHAQAHTQSLGETPCTGGKFQRYQNQNNNFGHLLHSFWLNKNQN